MSIFKALGLKRWRAMTANGWRYVLGGLSALNLILNEMTVQELINALVNLPKDKIVVLTEPDGIGWDNIGQVIEEGSTVKITMDGNHPFED